MNPRPTAAEFEALAWEWSHLRGHDPNDTFFVSTDDGYDVVTGDHAACYLAETAMWKALACHPPRTGLVRDVSSDTEARDAVLRTTNFSRRETMPRVTLAYDTAWKQYTEHCETVEVTTLRRVLYGPCGRNGLFHTFFVLPLVTLHPESVRWSTASVKATGLYDRFDEPSEHFDAWANRLLEAVLGYRSHEVQPLHGRWPDIAPIVRARMAREGIGEAT